MVVLFEKDPFVELTDSFAQSGGGSQHNVRRPLYGLSIKKDRFAFLSVYQASPSGTTKAISLVDSSAPGGHSQANHNFLLQAVTTSRTEKAQIVETFGDNFVFFYGEKPMILQCAGVLMNTRDFNWKNEWLRNYDKYLRGTKCVEARARVYLGFDDVLVEGWLMATSVSQAAQEMPYFCPFSFSFLVARYTDLSLSLNTVVTSSNAKNVVDGVGIGARMTASGKLVEYLTSQEGAPYMVIDPATGEVSEQSSAYNNGNIPASIQDGSLNARSAAWVTGGRSSRQWKAADEALLDVERSILVQQTGSDSVTVRRQQLAGSLSTLSRRSSASAHLQAALSTGVSNAALVYTAE